MNKASHVTQMLKDKIERQKLPGKKSNFIGSRGIAELKLMRGKAINQKR
jgi:hypothetical protein